MSTDRGLSFSFSEEQEAIRRLAAQFAEKEIKPVARRFEHDLEGRLAEEIIDRAAAVGLLALPVPKEFGGGGGSNVDCTLVLEELAVGCGGVATAIGASWFGQTPVMMAASAEQRRWVFPPLASADKGRLVCMAMTEPAGGTDIENPQMESRTIRTLVREDGDCYVINGRKLWPSNSDNAWLYTVVATADPKTGNAGSCLILVPAGTPGLSFGRPIRKMGMDADRNAEIVFEQVRVPRTHLLGRIGDGARLLQRTLVYNRVGAAAIAVGIARGAFEQALAWTRSRITMGRPLAQHPVIAAMLGDMATEIDAARLLYQRAAWCNAQPGQANMRWATMAKVFASEMAMRVTTNAVQVMGAYGYAKEYGVEKAMRDAKIVQIFIGANEFARQLVGELLT
ncbi:MAG: acyl-CoA dehydrogenase family protein [Deltaproteobacteria bacterium]|jgi:alkylation response protein AidB-like acyl-CoA dehydrogenase|nr:acyl-CoA dehydrogenase family protein [Deltaproteobacteria bacterium]